MSKTKAIGCAAPSLCAVHTRRVLLVIDHLDSGGAPVVVRDLIVGMVGAGVDVTLVLLSDRQRHVLPSSVKVIKLPYVAAGVVARQLRYRHHARMLDEWLYRDAGNFDLTFVHLHRAHQIVSRSHLANTAWYCLHSDPVTEFLGNKSRVGGWLKRRKVRLLYNRKRIVTVSQGILARLESEFRVVPTRGLSIHNPVDIARIRYLSSLPVDDAPDDFLLFVGRLDQRAKRFDRLLDAYRDSGVTLPLVLIGDGSAAHEVTTMIRERGLEERVWLIGARDNPFAYMARAKALLLSSDYEGFSLVLVEALACKTPVVSVDCPSGPAEILTGKLSRWLVPLNDRAAFAQAIIDVVVTPPVIHDDACQRFDVSTVASRYLDLGGDDGAPVHAQ
ncbi:glycosyltransferase [Halomonas sp. DP8Y7-3]|uniref:glycosyltransferase n=1 Tax=Halomonas sp. DP8Y7-3 TaxID=2859079 RepID=UPI001C9717A3|nr:glycosyltransferase [Halomonas sp. DP8Y7-3]MBY5930373.1 glycosyltransferase [Halomonas sp. DP8Y7-3]